ncbi:hypothetical protein EV667_4064 [Ancylobacter aquaticus]|uniref:Uncharacterized protein n=1 Tax=Ancylobacter aquaticus TaxID=100 RepID=A0A4V2PH76_ANCAQ|nr:hypothetical protein [Ancylobacter aquaticus]TCK19626.1 hypothetical protein EV667_4064 [Ancylobacter aquaticus]
MSEDQKKLFEARACILDLVVKKLSEINYSVRKRSTYINFTINTNLSRNTFQVLDKDYRYMHCFELHCGINWKNVWKIVWIDDPTIKDEMFNDIALIGLMSTSNPKFASLEYRSLYEVESLSDRIVEYHNEIVVPFFDKWSDYSKIKDEFFEASESAKSVCLLESDVSRIAIAIAIVDGDTELARGLIQKHGARFVSDPRSMRKMERFFETLRARSLV